MTYQDDLSYLYSLSKFGIKMGLSNIRELCVLLNNPQERFKTIHIGGTNGKGSTAAILASVLQKSGYRVGLYTSPHLSAFTERIRIDNVPVSEDRVSGLIHQIRSCPGYDSITPTFFELTTALALLYFAQEAVDIAVIEVGMGGRLDATNIITPLVSVITNVGQDHSEHLGPSLENIAMEKCGIIKNGVPVVTTEIRRDILSIIRQVADRAESRVYVSENDFNVYPVEIASDHSEFLYQGLIMKGPILRTSLPGRHQMLNMGAALCTLELLMNMGYEVTEEHVRNGIADVSWPGRLEILSDSPRFILDGAHNHAGTVVLKDFIEDVLQSEDGCGRIILIFGVLKEKDAFSMMNELISVSSEIILTRPSNERGLPAEVLEEIAVQSGIEPYITQSVSEALALAGRIALPSDTIIVTGSLYVVGEARAIINNKCMSP